MDMSQMAGLLPSWLDERTIADALAEGGIVWLTGRAVLLMALLVGWMALL